MEADDYSERGDDGTASRRQISRWSGVGSLSIRNLALLDEQGQKQTTFTANRPMSISFDALAEAPGQFPLIPAVLIFRLDGLVATRHVAEEVTVDVDTGDVLPIQLDLGPLQLGNGLYVVSVGLYRSLDIEDVQPSEFYDYLDKSYEFKVVGNPPLHNELFRHPAEWTMSSASVGPLTSRERASAKR